MTSLFLGHLRNGIPADEKVVRNTAETVNHDEPPAMADDAPEMGEVETDSNPTHGMQPRQLASKWTDRMRSVPEWIGNVSNGTAHNAIINEQVSSAGFAPSKEARGEWGHGTIPYAEGIEPVGDLRDGGKYGNEYFAALKRPIQDTADNNALTPVSGNSDTNSNVAATGKVYARQAAMSAVYSAFWNDGQ